MKLFVTSKKTPETIAINPDGSASRNAFPASVQSSYLRKGTNGVWLTGYNLPFGILEEEVLKDKSHSFYEKMIEKRMIESSLKISLDSADSNEFLKKISIPLADKGNRLPVLDITDPLQLLMYRAAIAGGIIAPDIESLNLPKYGDTNYYFSNPAYEAKSKKTVSKIKDKIGAKMSVNEDNRMFMLYGHMKLNIPYSPSYSTDTLYSQLSSHKDKFVKEKDLQDMLNVLDKDKIDMMYEFVSEQAIKLMFVYINNDIQHYIFNDQNLASSKKPLIESLRLKENDIHYRALKEMIWKRYQII